MANTIQSRYSRSIPAIIILVVAFSVLSLHALNLPVLESESVSIWMTEDVAPMTDVSLGEAVRGLVDNLQSLVERVRISPYTPLHTVILDIWRLPVKDNLFLMRALSIGFYLAGMYLSYHLCRRFTSSRSALASVAVLIIFGYVQVIGASVTPFALLFLMSAVTHFAFLRWNQKSTLSNALLYFLSLTLTIMTHGVGLLLITFHAVMQLARIRRLMKGNWTLDALSDANEKAGLLFWMLSAGLSGAVYWLWANIIAHEAITELSMQSNLLPAFIALILPFIAFAVAFFLNRAENARWFGAYAGLVIVLALASWWFAPQLPDWRGFINPINIERYATEPIVYDYTPYSPLAYMTTQQNFSGGIALDLSWREYQPEELVQIAESLTQGGLPIWFIADWQNEHLEMLWTLITTQHDYTQTFTDVELVGQFTLMRFERID